MKTITRPTITQLQEAPIGSRLLIWVNKEEYMSHPETPNRLAVKTISHPEIDQWVGIGKTRSSNEFVMSVWYKVKLQIKEIN